MNTIHQSQLSRLRHDPQDWRSMENQQVLSFGQWLERYVGEVGRDWGRSYCLDLTSPNYGTTWWFRNPANATLTLLRWS